MSQLFIILFSFLLVFLSGVESGFCGIDFGREKASEISSTNTVTASGKTSSGNSTSSGLTVGDVYTMMSSGNMSLEEVNEALNPSSGAKRMPGARSGKVLSNSGGIGSEKVAGSGVDIIGVNDEPTQTLFGPILDLDRNLLISMRKLADPSNQLLLSLIRYGGEVIVFIVPFFLLILWLIGTFRRDDRYKRQSLILFYGIAFAFIFYAVVNFFLPQFRPSPQTVAGALAPIIDHPLDNSFPSGHAIFGGAFFTGILLLAFPVSVTMSFFIFLCITLFSRIVGGVHYPGDILFGLILGIFTVKWFHTHIVSQPFFDRIFILPLIRLASRLHL